MCFYVLQVSPVGTKPHFSITRRHFVLNDRVEGNQSSIVNFFICSSLDQHRWDKCRASYFIYLLNMAANIQKMGNYEYLCAKN